MVNSDGNGAMPDQSVRKSKPVLDTDPPDAGVKSVNSAAVTKTVMGVNLEVRAKVAEYLHQRDRRPGWVYLMRDTKRPQIKKIGMTRIHPDRRAQALKKSCGHKLEIMHFIKLDRGCERLEALIHANLRPRRALGCCQKRCGKMHGEYFDIADDARVHAIFSTWERFMRKDPYNDVGRLKYEWQDHLEDVNEEFGSRAIYVHWLEDWNIRFVAGPPKQQKGIDKPKVTGRIK